MLMQKSEFHSQCWHRWHIRKQDFTYSARQCYRLWLAYQSPSEGKMVSGEETWWILRILRRIKCIKLGVLGVVGGLKRGLYSLPPCWLTLYMIYVLKKTNKRTSVQRERCCRVWSRLCIYFSKKWEWWSQTPGRQMCDSAACSCIYMLPYSLLTV